MDGGKLENHNIILEDRKRFVLTGVTQVISFDEETIMLETSLGRLVIKGAGLKILNFEAQIGDLTGEGKVFALIYTANDNGGGFLSRIFRWVMWEISNSFQLLGFLYSLGLGGIFCIIYDFLRVIRKNGFNSDFAVCLQDLLYFIFVSPATFCFLLATTNGEIRAYVLVGIIVGFVIIRLTVSRVALIVFAYFIKAFLKIYNRLYQVFNYIFTSINKFYSYTTDFFGKNLIKFLKCCKKLLKIQ